MTDTISNDDGAQWPVLDRLPSGGLRGRLLGASRTTAMTAAVSLVLLGGVATATVRSLAPADDAATVVPASAFAIAQLDLSLPDGQADATARLLDRFPGALKGNGSIRDRLLRAFFKTTNDPHVDYDKSVKSWLGDHVAIAGWTDASGSPQVEYVVQSTDDAAARKAIRAASQDIGIAFSHGFAVLASSQQAADAAVRAAGKSALADKATYSGDIAALGGTPALTGWADGPGLAKALTHAFSSAAPSGLDFLSSGNFPADAKGRIVLGLRVSNDGDNSAVQLDVIARGAPKTGASTATDRLRHLPASTFAAAAIADPASIVRNAVNAFQGSLGLFLGGVSGGETCSFSTGNSTTQCQSTEPTGPTDPLAVITDATGLKLPDDLVALLGSDAVVAYGGLTGNGEPKIGVRSKPADVTAAADVVTKLRDRLAATGVDLAERVDGGDFVVATTDDYAAALAKPGALGTVGRFADAMRGMPSSVQFAAYVDLGSLLPLLTHGQAPQLDHLNAVGIWAGTLNGMPETRLRLVVH